MEEHEWEHNTDEQGVTQSNSRFKKTPLVRIGSRAGKYRDTALPPPSSPHIPPFSLDIVASPLPTLYSPKHSGSPWPTPEKRKKKAVVLEPKDW